MNVATRNPRLLLDPRWSRYFVPEVVQLEHARICRGRRIGRERRKKIEARSRRASIDWTLRTSNFEYRVVWREAV